MNEETNSHHSKPPWLKVRLKQGPNFRELKQLVHDNRLHTICESAQCPNIWECWEQRTATFMILGDICTRSCGFCAVKTGRPGGELDWDGPEAGNGLLVLLGAGEACLYLASFQVLPPDVAAWLPVVACGMGATWCARHAET